MERGKLICTNSNQVLLSISNYLRYSQLLPSNPISQLEPSGHSL